MVIVGISGAKRSGKNTFSSLIAEELDNYSIKVQEGSWARFVKESAYESLGIAEEEDYKFYELWANAFKESHKLQIVNADGKVIHTISGRKFLQRYGTEAHRELFGENFWIDAFWDNNSFQNADVLIITDCRFDNEAESVKSKDGIVVKIQNNKAEANNDNHDSERGISEELIDFVVENNGSVEELKSIASVFAERIVFKLKNG